MPGASPLGDDLDTVKRAGGRRRLAPSSCTRSSRSRSRASSWRLRRTSKAHDESFAEALDATSRARRVPPRPRGVPRADPQGQGGGQRPGDRLAQRHTTGGWLDYAQARSSRPAPTRSSSTSTRSPPTSPNERRAGRRRARCDMVQAVVQGRPRSRWPSSSRRSTPSLAHFAQQARRGGRRRPRALQPLLPARHRRRGAGGRPQARSCPTRPSCLLRLRWLAMLSGTVKASLAVTGGVHTALDVRSRRSWPARTRVQMVSALLQARAPGTSRRCASELAQLARGARVRVAAPGAGQHEPRGLPGPDRVRAAATTCCVLQSWRDAK